MSTEPAINDEDDALAVGDRTTRRSVIGRTLWSVNIALWGSLVLWIMLDPKFGLAAHVQKGQLHALLGYAVSPPTEPLGFRVPTLWILLSVALASLVGIFLSLFLGSVSHRGLRAWLLFMLLVAAWLTVLVGWREVAWQGQRLRLGGMVAQFDAVAQSLRDDWPTTDGERDGLGSFMAYPQGNPRMLMMLVSTTDPQISAIERANDGSLGFEIRGEQPGTWLEWHPPGSQPATFVGGLEEDHDLGRVSSLGDGWYQVRYGKQMNPSSTSRSE